MKIRTLLVSSALFGALSTLCFPVSLNGLGHDRPAMFLVRFLATGTVVHSGWAGNQDVYLVELKTKKSDGAPVLAKLVDEYPEYERSIPRRLLLAEGSPMKLRRDPACDIRYIDMPKRAAPGDPMAIYPAPMNFVPDTRAQVDPSQMVHCYRLVRR